MTCLRVTIDGHVEMESIEAAMSVALLDASKMFTVKLNGESETFIYHANAMERGNSHKRFTRLSWSYSELYWYKIYGAITTRKGHTLITPCAFRHRRKLNSVFILVAIGETRCNRPRYDGLVLDEETGECFFLQGITSVIQEFLFDHAFDRAKLDDTVARYLALNRWVYDASRGLPIDCKSPMQSDTTMKQEVKQDVVKVESAKCLRATSKSSTDVKKTAPNVKIVVKKRQVKNRRVKSPSPSSDSEHTELSQSPSPPPRKKRALPQKCDTAVARDQSQVTSDPAPAAVRSSSPFSNALFSTPSVAGPSGGYNCAGEGFPIESFTDMMYETLATKARLAEYKLKLAESERQLAERKEQDERANFKSQLLAFWRFANK